MRFSTFDLVVDASTRPVCSGYRQCARMPRRLPARRRANLIRAGQATRARAPVPRAPPAQRGLRVSEAPELLEILQHAGDEERSIDAIRLVQAHAIDDSAAVLRDHVEEIVHDRRVGTGARTSSRNRPHMSIATASMRAAVRPNEFEERPDTGALALAGEPDDPLRRRLDDHRGVAMAFLDRKLVDSQQPQAGQTLRG